MKKKELISELNKIVKDNKDASVSDVDMYGEQLHELLFKKSSTHTLIFIIFALLSVIFIKKSNSLSFVSLETYLSMVTIFALISFIIMLVFFTLYIYNKKKNVVLTKENVKKEFSFFEFYDIVGFIFIVTTTLFWCVIFILTPVEVRGDSMIDTCYNEDKVIVWHLAYKIERGDIVVADALNYNFIDETDFIIKRVIAKPGDVITFSKDKKELRINGEVVTFKNQWSEFTLDYFQTMLTVVGDVNQIHYSLNESDGLYQGTVPAGYYVLFGDNYSNSQDSRFVGLIKEEDILGICIFRIFPFDRFGVLN